MPSSVSKSSLKFQFMHVMLCVSCCDTAPAAGQQLCPAALGINLSRVTTFRRCAVGKSIANVAPCMGRQFYAPCVACSRAKSKKKRACTSRLSPSSPRCHPLIMFPTRGPRGLQLHTRWSYCAPEWLVATSRRSREIREDVIGKWADSLCRQISFIARLALEASTPQNISGTFLRQRLWASQPVR